MKKYLLDTNICIFYMKGKYQLNIKVRKARQQNCYISEITVAELLYGAAFSQDKERNLAEVNEFISKFEILPIRPALEIFGESKATLRKQGLLIDDFDILIGATAVINKMIMVSENQKHLSRIPGIKTENWVMR